jgi:hypothetical protein
LRASRRWRATVRSRPHPLENFWSLFKRCINGTYVAVDAHHLERYADEQVWRFNERQLNDAQRLGVTMLGVPAKRLMYKELIGEEAPVGYSPVAGEGDGPTAD